MDLNLIVFIQGMIIGVLCAYILYKKFKHDGEIVVVMDDDGKKVFSLELDKTPEEIEQMSFITFKVCPQDKHAL